MKDITNIRWIKKTMNKRTENFSEGRNKILSQKEAQRRLKEMEVWKFSLDEKKIFKSFHFKTFSETIDFVNGAASLATKINHYPDVMIVRFRMVTVGLTTRESGGLTENDFMLARELDAIAGWKSRLERLLISPKAFAVLLIIFLLVLFWQYLL